MTIFTELISNMALLLALCILYSFLTRIWRYGEITGRIFAGILFGGVAVAGMMLPFHYAPGIIFDGRSMVVSLAGLFGGPVAAGVSALIAGVYRLGLGGAGALTGLCVVFTSAALGTGYYYLRRKNPDVIKPPYLLAFGIIVHASMLLCMLTLPWPVAFEVLHKISIPVMLIFPAGTLFLGTLLADQEEHIYAREALRESEQRFREMADLLPQTVFEIDERGNLIFVNRNAYDVVGYTREDFDKGLNALQMLIPEDHERAGGNIQKVLGGEKISDIEYTARRKNGSSFPVFIYSNPVIHNNKTVGLRGIIIDITERKQAEEVLRQSEERFRTAGELAYDLIYEWDIASDNLQWFGDVDGLLGYKKGEISRDIKAWLDLIHPEDRDVLENAVEIHRTSKEPINDEYRVRHRDGTYRYWIDRGQPLFGDKDHPYKWMGVCKDITKRKQAEKTLEENEERYKQIFQFSPDAIIIHDMDMNILNVNNKAVEEFGYSKEELLEKTIHELHPETELKQSAQVLAIMKKTDMLNVETKFIRKDGSVFLAEATPCKYTLGGKSIIHVVIRDITEKRKAEEKIRRSLREKEALLAEIHHRVKNNMQIISSLLSLQSRDIEDERALSLIRNCEDRIKSMSLVHEKLYLAEDLSEIDFHDYMKDLSARLFQVHRVDSRVVRFSSQIKDVLFNIETAIPLGLIINELISNALKHAFPEGGKGNIAVKLTQNKKTEECTLTVKDNGIGFPDKIDYINTETFGLQLVKMLTEQLHGTMELDRNKGTSFKIIFKEQEYRKRI